METLLRSLFSLLAIACRWPRRVLSLIQTNAACKGQKRQFLPLLTVLISCSIISGCHSFFGILKPTTASMEPIALDGEWRFLVEPLPSDDLSPTQADFDDTHWPTITVPSNWYSEGFDVHGQHWYRTRFQLSKAQVSLLSRGARLHFEGVDYYAQVWLNGSLLGQHQGYFAAFSFATDKALKIGENVLAIRVDSPLEAQQDDNWSLHKTLIKGVLSHHDTRPGGAWGVFGQAHNSGGIWGQIALQAASDVQITQLSWHSQLQAQRSSAQLQLHYQGRAPEYWELSLQGQHFDDFYQQRFSVSSEPRQTLVLPWRQWRRWWPRELGEAHQYQLRLTAVYPKQRQLVHSMMVGFREVDYNGQLGQWYVNQQRLFLRGTNYIPTLYLSQLTEAQIRTDLALMAAAHINVVRVHALVLPQRFYELASEAGMLIWQDFPLQWGYQDSAAFTQEAQRQLAQMVHQFGHHSSIIAWSAHNEPPWDATWMRWKYSDYQPKQNQQLDYALYQQLLALDNSRPAFVASLTKEHPWLGWYSGHWQDYAQATDQPLITEFGAQALPSLPVWASIVPLSEDLAHPKNYQQWQFHNFQPKETFEIAQVDPGQNVAELIRNTQQYQARLIRFAAESLRRQKYQPVAAIFQFMLMEHWPSANWGVLDYLRNPKPGYYALQQAYQPLLVSIVAARDQFSHQEMIQLPVHILNDLPTTYADASLTLTLHRAEQILAQRQQQITVLADSHQPLKPFMQENLPQGQYRFSARLVDRQGQLLNQSHFNFEIKNDAYIPN